MRLPSMGVHLVNAGDWSEGLTCHWLVIRFIRACHARFDSVPMMKVLIKGLNKEAGEARHDMRFLYDGLIPDHPIKLL